MMSSRPRLFRKRVAGPESGAIAVFMRYLVSILAFAMACGGSQSAETLPPQTRRAPYQVASGDLEAAIAGEHRTDAERARDVFRKPLETLQHFGVQPNMTVLEVWPGGGGWYTKILAPYLRDSGRLIAGNMDPEDETFRGGFARRYLAMLDGAPEVYDQVERRVLAPGKLLEGVPDQSVDFVLSPRNTHNWIRNDAPTADYFSAVFRVLRPGGTFGVVQHRAPEGTEHGEDGTIGYLTESHVISLAEAAGFELADRSELHANEADTHDHPNGVWSLPPVLRGGDENREAFVAIGESDRMTLTFRRPAEEADAAEEANEDGVVRETSRRGAARSLSAVEDEEEELAR